MVYLDHNATTPVLPDVAQAMAQALARVGNASSVHALGRDARRSVEDARESVAVLAGARPAEVIFTSGGTEANNLALRGTGRERVLVSSVEHVSVLDAVAEAATVPVSIPNPNPIPVDGDGVVDIGALEALLAAAPGPALVSVMLANNETGVVQPVAKIAEAARRFGVLVHCDAVQGAGKMSLDMAGLGVDLLTLSAHKMGGPQGIGALIVRDGTPLNPEARGGGQERRRRAGTENVPAIVGFGVAAAGEGVAEAPRLRRLRDDLESRVVGVCGGARIFGAGAERLPNTCCVSMPGVANETQIMALDLAGVAVSAGSACSSGKVESSHVLAAMGVAPEQAATAIRVSLGHDTTEDDVSTFLEAWTGLYKRLGEPHDTAVPAPAAA